MLRPPVGPLLVHEVVVPDPEHPGFEVTPRPKRRYARECLEQRFLGQVLGCVPVAGQAVQPAVQLAPVALDQLGENPPPIK